MKFKARKPMKVGNSYALTIPAQYIKDGYIDPEQRYDVEVTPVEEDEGTS